MILHCSFEQLTALSSGAERVLTAPHGGGVGVAAPPQIVADLENLLPTLTGDLSILTYAQQQRLEGLLDYVLTHLKEQMDASILEQHVGSEDSVHAFFDYAHVLSLRDQLHSVGAEMSSMIELMTGSPPTAQSSRELAFPD